MSIHLISDASKLNFPNEPILKFVLIALCNFANADDEAWPSYPTLAKFCSISERTAVRHIKTLEEKGYICKTSRTHKNGRDTSNFYKITLARVSPCHPEGDTVTGGRVSPCHPSKENHKKEPIYCAPEGAPNRLTLFEKFWIEYPKKKKKKETIKIWTKLTDDKSLTNLAEKIIQDVIDRKLNDPQWQDIKFIPLPTSYLNGERWEDDKSTENKIQNDDWIYQ